MIRNWWLLTGIIMTLTAMFALAFYVLPRQYQETQRPKSHFTQFRWLIFLGELLLIFGMAPGLPRSFQILNVPPVNNWAKVAAVTNKVPYFAMMVVLILIYRFRDKE